MHFLRLVFTRQIFMYWLCTVGQAELGAGCLHWQ